MDKIERLKLELAYVQEMRKMWAWLAQEENHLKQDYMHEFHDGVTIFSGCFACEYVANTYPMEKEVCPYSGGVSKYINCDHCPLLGYAWSPQEEDEEDEAPPCQQSGSPYLDWFLDVTERLDAAREIVKACDSRVKDIQSFLKREGAV
jgi:hypothetical protein